MALMLLTGAFAASAQPALPPPDPEFEAALPPLDASATAPAPAPTPIATPDPELSQPLIPLATFQANPPAPTPAQAAAATDQEAPKIAYDLNLKGLDEVGLTATFKPLSALLKDGKKAANASQIGARADEDVQLAERLLKSEGYYDGTAAADIPPVAKPDQKLQVTITAIPGARYHLGAIEVTGAAPEPRGYALEALALKTGQPIQAAVIEGAEANVALTLPQQGYPFVKVGQRDIALDDATHAGDYTLPVDAGPKSRFGGIRTEGDPVFTPKHVAVLPRFKPGEVYDSRKVDDLRQALVATSLFSSVAVEPVRTGKLNPDGTEDVDLVVQQNKGPWRSLATDAGYGTGEGIKLTGSWTHRNLFPPEGALIVGAVAGTQEQSLSTTFRRSNAGKRDRTFQAAASVARQDFDAYNAQTINLSASISRASTPIWQKRWTYSVGGELIASRETRFVADADGRTRDTYLIAAVPLQLGYDRSNSLLDPTRGFRITGRLSPEAQKRDGGGGFEGYLRTLVEGSAYYPVTDSIVIAGRTRLGSIIGASANSIAPSRRYYAGGGGSVRGFGFQQLGPKDANNDPIGGKSLTEFALEARYRFGNYGIVPFIDAGRVGDSSMPSISHLRYGAGIGGRYYTNFGPMRVDIATPIDRQPGESKIALYISIGQAF